MQDRPCFGGAGQGALGVWMQGRGSWRPCALCWAGDQGYWGHPGLVVA